MHASGPSHFKGKDAIGHVVEAQTQGLIDAAEIHGTEIPGHLSAAADAAKDTALALGLLGILLTKLAVPAFDTLLLLIFFGGGWVLWKGGRSAWLGWSRLERLHRIVAQEKWEIEHNRQQERDELRVLYATKGFEGKLLEDVLDVLMADGDRLLRVMVEEELGLSLESQEHPLKQAVGASLGSLFAMAACAGIYSFFVLPGIVTASFIVIASSAAFAAYHEQNNLISAAIWNSGIAAVSFGFAFFMIDIVLPNLR